MTMPKGILGRKIGMTRLLDQETGAAIPVTVVEAGPCVVLQVKTEDSDGYTSVQLGFEDRKRKRTTKPMSGHFDKAGCPPKHFVREIRSSDAGGYEVGQVLTVTDLEGIEKVDVSGTSKGRGWSGTIRRWNHHRQNTTHGNTKHHRAPGSIGRAYSVHKGVPKGMKMAGRQGNRKVTVRGVEVVRSVPEENLLVVKGALPGPNGGYLVIRQSQKDPAYQP
jgi:large subunit ribosomal protein L3